LKNNVKISPRRNFEKYPKEINIQNFVSDEIRNQKPLKTGRAILMENIEGRPNKSEYSTLLIEDVPEKSRCGHITPGCATTTILVLQIMQTISLYGILACFIFLSVMGWKSYVYVSSINLDFSSDKLLCFMVKLFGHACGQVYIPLGA
jgi:hypothetical protein